MSDELSGMNHEQAYAAHLQQEVIRLRSEIRELTVELVTRTNERDTLREMLGDITEERDMTEAENRTLRSRLGPAGRPGW